MGAVRQHRAGKVARVPVIMQAEMAECGAACLAMVLASHGKWVAMGECRAACNVSRDGARASDVLAAARHWGLAADGYRLDIDDLVREDKLPCIIHWNFNHFVVLRGFRRGRAYLNDPAIGAYSVPLERFSKSYTGVCMVMRPEGSFERGGSRPSVLAFARRRLGAHGANVAFALCAAALGALFALLPALFNRTFLDLVLGYTPDGFLPRFLLLFAGVSAAIAVIEMARTAYSYRMFAALAVGSSSAYMDHLMRLPVGFFQQRSPGDLSMRAEANETIAGTLVNTLVPLALSVVMLAVYLAIMVGYSPVLSAVGLCSLAANLAITRIVAARRVNYARGLVYDQSRLATETASGIRAIETIKAMGAEGGYFQGWSGRQACVYAQMAKMAEVSQTLGALPSIVSSLANVAVLGTGMALCFRGEFTLGMVMAFQGFMQQFMNPAQRLLDSSQALQEMRTNTERIDDVMRYPRERVFADDEPDEGEVESSAVPAPGMRLAGRIELAGVAYSYSPLGPDFISDFNLVVEPGTSVGLVGPSGCGKSTVAALIATVLSPSRGRILYDGAPASALVRAAFFSSVAVVDQKPVLVKGTFADNIALWRPGVSRGDIERAARDACIYDDIVAREEGFDAPVEEGGANLSGGQRQRVELACALAGDPSVLILDEATSALDAQTERRVMEAVRRRGATLVVIAHRLSTIRDCDQIVVLEHGRVVERGTHESLVAARGRYTLLLADE